MNANKTKTLLKHFASPKLQQQIHQDPKSDIIICRLNNNNNKKKHYFELWTTVNLNTIIVKVHTGLKLEIHCRLLLTYERYKFISSLTILWIPHVEKITSEINKWLMRAQLFVRTFREHFGTLWHANKAAANILMHHLIYRPLLLIFEQKY